MQDGDIRSDGDPTSAALANLAFSEWGHVASDPRLVAAIVDRLGFHAHIIETGTESFPPEELAPGGEALISGPAARRRWQPPG